MKYIVPEYYQYFQCKCSNCRSSCCDGWPIRITRKEYFRLLGVTCSDQLRSRLDIALKVSPQPSNECYGLITTNWQGLCTLHREDGLCALQSELGEPSLPEVCKRYPRTTRQGAKHNECSCSNSCEKVVELLLEQQQPLQFLEMELLLEPEFLNVLNPIQYSSCQQSISLLQRRSLSLPERFLTLGNFLYGFEPSKDKPASLSEAFQLLLTMNQYYKHSRSISEYCQISQHYYGAPDEETLSPIQLAVLAQKHQLASGILEHTLPSWQVNLEQLLVNHMFYNSFPSADKWGNVCDIFLSLVCVYSFIKFTLLGNLQENTTKDKLTDIISALFRVIDHSGFQSVAISMSKGKSLSNDAMIAQLIYI